MISSHSIQPGPQKSWFAAKGEPQKKGQKSISGCRNTRACKMAVDDIIWLAGYTSHGAGQFVGCRCRGWFCWFRFSCFSLSVFKRDPWFCWFTIQIIGNLVARAFQMRLQIIVEPAQAVRARHRFRMPRHHDVLPVPTQCNRKARKTPSGKFSPRDKSYTPVSTERSTRRCCWHRY